MELLDGLCGTFISGEYRLLIIDSVMNLFRNDYIGRGELQERQAKLNQFLHRLAEIVGGAFERIVSPSVYALEC